MQLGRFCEWLLESGAAAYAGFVGAGFESSRVRIRGTYALGSTNGAEYSQASSWRLEK